MFLLPRRSALLFTASSAALALAVGCGGNVVVDHDSSTGGSGGSSATSTGSAINSTATSTSTSTGTGGGGPESLCAPLCDSLITGGCAPSPTCMKDCKESYDSSPGCTKELDGFYVCLVDGLKGSTSCDFPEGCFDAYEKFNQCLSPGDCSITACAGGPNSCDCSTFCFGSDYSASCFAQNGQVVCVCEIDGQTVGKCEDQGLVCDVFGSCCGNVF